jgi:hypothetical protein
MQTPKVMLIHGYGEGVINPFNPSNNDLCGFTGYKKFVEEGIASVYDWKLIDNPNKLQFLNPLYQYSRFLIDRKYSRLEETVDKLEKSIEIQKPECIIAHSLGGYLLMNALERNQYIGSILTKVVLLSTYLPANYNFAEKAFPFKVINYYCYWDNALIWLLPLEGHLPAGVVGFADKSVENRFYPLKDHINVHTSMCVSERFAESIIM